MVKIIAECGVNHGGNLNNAFKYIDAAKECGADAIKFQTWLPGEITGKYTSKCEYMKNGHGNKISRYEISETLRLEHNDFINLKNYSDSVGIEFLSTPDGEESLKFLLEHNLLKAIKVGSTEIVNISFLKKISESSLPVYLSTGTANLKEVINAVNIFSGNLENLTLMQCTSSYPCADNELNLNVLNQYKNLFSIKIGFSDHSLGSTASFAAVALGASIIEKHIYIESDIWTPDKNASMNKKDFKYMCNEIRRLEKMLGNGNKHRTTSEKENLKSIRRGLCAAKPLNKGTILKKEDIFYKRPYEGLSLNETKFIINRVINKNKEIDEPFTLDDFSK